MANRYILKAGKGRDYHVLKGKQKVATVQKPKHYKGLTHSFVLDHPDGHDYLICTEERCGLTIVRLDTGEINRYYPEQGQNLAWLMWDTPIVSPCKRYICANVMVWGAPGWTSVYDISDIWNPENWKVAHEFAICNSNAQEWTKGGKAVCFSYYDVFMPWNKAEFDMNPKELLKACELTKKDDDWMGYKDIYIWDPKTGKTRVEKKVPAPEFEGH